MMQPKHSPADRRGHDTSMTRETVEEMIAAALGRAALNPRTAARAENDKGRLDQYQKKIAILEHQRDEALDKITALEIERDGALDRVTMAENEANEAWDNADKGINRKQKEFDDMLATKDAKIAHLESQLAKIHSLSTSDETIASTSACPDSAGSECRRELASDDHVSPGTWVEDTWPGGSGKWETGSWN